MKILVAAALSIILFSSAFSQDKRFAKEDEVWLDGYAYLASGEKVKGKINYNFVTETIQLKTGQAVKTYPAKKVNRFKIENSNGDKIEYVSLFVSNISKPDIKKLKLQNQIVSEGNQFLCIQYKNSKAAILTSLDIDHEKYYHVDTEYNQSQTIDKEKLVERVYILDKRAIPYSVLLRVVDKKHKYKRGVSIYNANYDSNADQLTKKNPKNLNEENPKYKLVNKDFLQELDPTNHKKLEAYIDSHDIDVKTIEGLVKVIDYWSEI